MSIFFYIFVDETENLLVMKKFFVGLMLLCGALALHADDVIYYFHQAHPGISGWWRSDNCQPAIYATSADGETENAPWPGVEMSYSERDGDNDLWHLSIDTTIYKKITFVRVYYSAGICTDQNSKTQEFNISDLNGRNFFSLTSETQMEIVEGEWFYYGNAYSLPGQPMYYLLGDAAALGAWSTESALPMEGDSIVLNLDPGTYNFKVLTGQSWDNPSYGYSAVNSNCTDVAVQEGSDGNIQITLGSGSEIVVKNVGAGTSSGVICITGNQGTPDGGNLGATRVYCYVTQDWWTSDQAAVGMYAYDDNDNVNAAFPGERMAADNQVPGLWSAEINPDMFNHIIFTRINPSDDGELSWGAQTANLSVPTSATPVFVITSSTATWTPETVEGYWTAYSETGVYNDTQGGASYTYYLTGSFNEWSLGNALGMDGDSIVLNLEGVYNFKVLVSNVTWDGAMGYNSLDNLHSTTEYVSAGEDDNLEVYIPGGYEVHFFVEQATVRVSVVPKATTTIDGIKYTLSGSAPWIAEVAKQDVETFSLSIVNIPSTITYNEQTYTVTRIANDAFSPISTITDVTIPNTVTYIGPEAFHDCNNLSSVNLPNGIIEIGDVVFDGTALESPLFNDAMFVFLPREREGEFSIPTGIQVIANSAFSGCGSLTGITIPSGVTTIGVGAFADCSSLTQVTLPSTVNSIGEAAFNDCSELEAINLPEGITKIDKYTFRGCQELAAITIPSTVDSICDEAFGSCISLHTVICLPTTPPFLHDYAFTGIQALNELYIYVPAASLNAYLAEEAWQFPAPVQAICPNTGTCGADGYTINWTLDCDSVLTIDGTGLMADYEFEGTPWYRYRERVTRAVVTSGVTRIGAFAFYNLPNLRSVEIQGDITGVGTYAFSLCTSLHQVSLPSTVTRIEDNGFEGSGLTSIVLPSSMTSVESYVFSGCNNLRYVEIPAGVTSFSAGAFEHCVFDTIRCYATTPPEMEESFESDGINAIVLIPFGTLAAYQEDEYWGEFSNFVEMPCTRASGTCGAQGNNLTWILDCDSVLTVSGTGAMMDYSVNSNGQAPWAEYGLLISKIVISEGVTKVGANAFYNAGSYTNGAYNNVRSLSIPSTLETLTNNNFYMCPIDTVAINSDSIVGKGSYSSNSSMHKIFGAQVRQYIIGSSVHSIAQSAFYNQSADSLRSVILPEGLTSIGDWGFGYLENLDSIVLPSTLQTIGADAFYGSGLQKVTIPAGVTTMGGQAFQNCDKLTSVTFEEGLTAIGTSAFTNCTALPEITIPESMQTISSGAFSGCTNLTKVTILSPTWVGENKSSSTTTKQALGNYIRELVLGGSITRLGKYSFSSIDSLRKVTLPDNLEIIGEHSFTSCEKLQSVTLPSSTTTIDNYAFSGCTALDSVGLNEGLLRIETQVFSGCTSLPRIALPASLIGIGGTSFYGCTALTELTVPDGALLADSLGNNIFVGCSNLTKLTVNSRTLCEGTYNTTKNLKSLLGQDALRTLIIGEGVTSIGNYAFYGSTITALELPSTLTQIGTSSFGSCSSLTRVTSSAQTPPTTVSNTFSTKDTLIVPCEANTAYTQAQYWQDFSSILSNIASGECGAQGNNLTWTIDCNYVLTITGEGAMADYMGSSYVPWSNYSNVIREAVVGSGVTSLSEYSTFENCTALESVILPEGITSLGGYTFNNCTSLKGIDLPSTLTSLGSYCFGDCNAIDSIVSRAMTPPTANGSTFSFAGETVAVYVPEAAMSSYQSADGWSNFSDFRALVLPPLASGYCGAEGDSTNLAWVLGADSVLTITGTGAMANFAGTNQVPWYEYSEAIATADIIEGVTSIGNYAFMNLPNLRIVNLPEGLTRIGQSAFYMCAGLREINFPGTITEVANGAFDQTSIENPVYNMSIFAYMPKTFSGTYSIPEGVEKIAGYAFESCTLLTSVTIPQSVNSIGGSAFGYCTSLESVNIPDGITYIEGYTFTNCTSLSSIEIPASVNRIANMAFNGCSSLGNIYCRGAYPPSDDLQNAFTGIDSTILTVFVPSRSVALYQAADGWKKFSNIRGQDDPNRFTMPISTEWQFIMLPGVTGDQWCGLPMDSILSDSTLVWARYVGNYRAEGRSGWQLFDPAANEARFLCTDAYIVRANGAGATLTMKVPVDAANMTSVTYTYEKHTARHAENANWNFVGNPFPYYYNILAQLDAMGVTTPITIWNGTGYEIFTPGIDTERMLAPFEAFFIQVPDDMESLVVEFSGEYIIM